MSWWNDFAKWVNSIGPQYTVSQQEMQARQAATAKIQKEWQKPQYAGAPTMVVGPTVVRNAGFGAASDVLQGMQGTASSQLVDALMTPVRKVSELAAAPILSAVTGKSLAETYDLARGKNAPNWWQSGENPVTLGQALYGLGGKILPGQQEVDSIDWTNREEVQRYFSDGPQKYLTGTLDGILSFALDPVLLAGFGMSKARVHFGVAPIKGPRDVARVRRIVDGAVAGRTTPASPLLDMVMTNPYSPKIREHVAILASSNQEFLSSALEYAGTVGDRQLAGEILKAATGDLQAINGLVARRDTVSGMIAGFQHELENARTGVVPLTSDQIDLISNSITEAQRMSDALEKTVGVEGKAIGAAGSMMNRTFSRLTAIERRRVKYAEKRYRSTFGVENDSASGFIVRKVSWLNPSSTVREAPSGVFNLTGLPSVEGSREMAAVLGRMKKHTNQDYSEVMRQYMNLATPEQRYAFLHDFETGTFHLDLIKAAIGKSLSDEDMQVLRLFAEKIGKGRVQKMNMDMADVVRRNYIVIDEETANTFQFQQLRSAFEQQAQDMGITYEELVNRMASRPTLASQTANLYPFPQVDDYAKFVRENRKVFEAAVKEIRSLREQYQQGLNAYDITGRKVDVEKLIDDELTRIFNQKSDYIGVPQKVQKIARLPLDASTVLADALYSNFWKPITLLSFKYTARNVLEGHLRTAVFFQEAHQLTGESYASFVRDWAAGKPSATLKNLELRMERSGAAKQYKLLSPEVKQRAIIADQLVRDSVRVAQNSAEKLSDMARIISSVRDKKGNPITPPIVQDFLDGVFNTRTMPSGKSIRQTSAGKTYVGPSPRINVKAVRSLYTVKNSEARRFLIMLLDGDVEQAMVLMRKTRDVSSFTSQIADFRDYLRYVASSFDEPLLSGKYDAWLPKTHVVRISDYQQSLLDLAEQLDTVISTRANQALAWREYSTLTVGMNPIFHRRGEGIYEFNLKGQKVIIPDFAHGQLGEFAYRDASSDRTFAASVLDQNRLIGQSSSVKSVSNAVIKPSNSNWAKAYVDFVAHDLRSDEAAYMVMSGRSDQEIMDFLTSEAGRNYRQAVGMETVASFPEASERLDYVKNLVELYLPELPNTPPEMLKRAALDGAINPANVTDYLPVEYRPSVVGEDIVGLKIGRSEMQRFRKVLPSIFKWIGSMPETKLARHPFYQSMYRAECRRISKVLQAQGADLASHETVDFIVRNAHRAAFKALNETLYTITRKTVPAQWFRFMSPFYMAQENSARFWMGQSFKNPAIPYLGLLAWNTPNRVFNVVDDQGNSVESSLPWTSNEQIMFTLPEPLAKYFGQDYVYLTKTSFDLATNGNIPFVSWFSGPFVSVPFSALTKVFPIQKALTDLGLPGDFIETTLMPYVDVTTGYNIPSQFLPTPAWARAAYNAISMDTPQAAARWNMIIEQKALEADQNNEVLDEKKRAQIMVDAYETARKSYLFEALFSTTSPVGIKFTDKMDLMRREYQRYVTRYGPIDGPVKAAEQMGTIETVYASSSLSNNPSGLLATPQTEANLNNHMDLAEQIAQVTKGENAFSLLGAMFNEGTSRDYSSLVNQRFYSMNIATVDVKSKEESPLVAQTRREVSSGWQYWIPFKQAVLAKAAASGVRVGTKEWDTNWKPALDGMAEIIGKKYPAWNQARQEINKGRVSQNVQVVKLALSNKSFMKDIGKKNPTWQAAKAWIEFRDSLALVLQARGTGINAQQNQDIVEARDQMAQIISLKYPSFTSLYERYLANDDLTIAG